MKWMLIILFLFWGSACRSQDSSKTYKKWQLNGYIKNLESISFDKNFENSSTLYLFHNRLNMKWRPSGHLTVSAEFRNRIFFGREINNNQDFANQLRNENENSNLQIIWVNNNSMVIHTNTERLNIEYRKAKWNVKIGRQRINWGITTTWNPNDIFNTYNFLDVDYEERPGMDGGRFQYIFNNASNAEIAYANTGNRKGNVAAVKYNLNKWGYDMQLITGWYKEYITLGAGWAGNIKNAGFKGEAQYFFGQQDSIDHFNLSLEGDYLFKKGWYVSVGFLFNKNGLDHSINDWNRINLKLSPENLMPTKWNFMVTGSKEVTPLFTVGFSMLYAPGTQLIILIPSLRYNLSANLDAELIWQSFFAEINTNLEAVNHRGFVRLKYSF